MSHTATDEEVSKANAGQILCLLHDPSRPSPCPTYHSGTQAKRAPHKLGLRRAEGPISESSYSLSDHNIITDPYRPNVTFPENSKERHGGRKRITTSKRGLNLTKLVNESFSDLCNVVLIEKHKMKHHVHAESYHIYSSQETIYQDNSNSLPSSLNIFSPPSKKPKYKSKLSLSKKTGNIALLCSKCLFEGSPYRCINQKSLDIHIKLKHNQNSIICSECYDKSGVNIMFSNYKQFKHHLNECHSDYGQT